MLDKILHFLNIKFDILLPNLVTIVIAGFTIYKDCIVFKKDVYKHRLEKVYIPFYHKYLFFKLGLTISDISSEQIVEISQLLGNNIELLSTKSQTLYLNFYKTQLEFIEARNHALGKKQYQLAKDQIDTHWQLLLVEVMKEYKVLSKKLKLPKPIR